MATIVPTSELEAVNAIIDTIGEPEVLDLDVAGSYDVTRARTLLTRELRSLLKVGWWFNTELRTLTPDINTKMPVPLNVLYIEPSHYSAFGLRGNSEFGPDRYTLRGSFMYDRFDATFTGFDSDMEVKVYVSLEWEELPESAREVIYKRAATSFIRKSLGELNLTQAEAMDERDAFADLQREEHKQVRTTLLDNPRIVRGMHRRRNRWL